MPKMRVRGSFSASVKAECPGSLCGTPSVSATVIGMSVIAVGACETRTGPVDFGGFTISSAIALPAMTEILPSGRTRSCANCRGLSPIP